MTITVHIHELNLLEDTLQNQYDSNFESDHEMIGGLRLLFATNLNKYTKHLN